MSRFYNIGTWIKSKKALKILVYLLIFILLIIIMDTFVMPFYVRLGEETELPDVVEMAVADAVKKLNDQDFIAIISDSVYNTHYEKGVVVEQMPPPYSTVKKGRHVYLTISIGEKPIIMPLLFSKSLTQAKLNLEEFGLKLGSVEYDWYDAYPENIVIAQSFPQGQIVKRGEKINLTISLGSPPKTKTIPYLVNNSLDMAKKQLNTLGIKNIEIEYEEKENILPNTILKQSLKEGEQVDENTKIKLIVSKLKSEETE